MRTINIFCSTKNFIFTSDNKNVFSHISTTLICSFDVQLFLRHIFATHPCAFPSFKPSSVLPLYNWNLTCGTFETACITISQDVSIDCVSIFWGINSRPSVMSETKFTLGISVYNRDIANVLPLVQCILKWSRDSSRQTTGRMTQYSSQWSFMKYSSCYRSKTEELLFVISNNIWTFWLVVHSLNDRFTLYNMYFCWKLIFQWFFKFRNFQSKFSQKCISQLTNLKTLYRSQFLVYWLRIFNKQCRKVWKIQWYPKLTKKFPTFGRTVQIAPHIIKQILIKIMK